MCRNSAAGNASIHGMSLLVAQPCRDRPRYHVVPMALGCVLLALWIAGWIHSRLRDENRVLRAQLGGCRLQFR